MVESRPQTTETRRRAARRRALCGLTVVLVCLGPLSGCGGRNPRNYEVPEPRRLEADIGSVWEAASRILAERGYVVRSSDRETGAIETDWLTVNPDYSASVFLTRHEDRYSDCGKPGLGRTYRRKQARLTVSLTAAGTSRTDVLVRAAFRTERTTIFFGAPAVLECRSRGRLEEEFLVEAQVRALTNTLQRFRRDLQ